MTGHAQQVAVGSVAEEICVGTDMPRDAETRRGYGLPKVRHSPM